VKLLACAGLLAAAVATAATGAVSQGDWGQYGGDSAEQHFSPLTAVNAANVVGLGLAWSFELDTNRGQESIPVVRDGVMYVSTAWSKVFALDARDGRSLWSFDPKVPGARAFNACCDVVNRGVAVADGRVFVGTVDGRLIALDAKTGRPVWTTRTVPDGRPYSITGAPRVFDHKVIIGNAGGEYGVRGYVTAYDAASGRQVWRFYTIPGNPVGPKDGAASDAALARIATPTWYGHWYDYGGGGTVWDAIVVDADLGQIYIGVGNGTPWDRRVRSLGQGDNLFLASIVALDATTGAYRWHYQESPGESWDYDATQPMMLSSLQINGAVTPVVMQASKNGFFYVLDRRSGKLVSANNFIKENWADGIDMSTGRPRTRGDIFYDKSNFMMPGAIGGHSWQPTSFSPATGLVYIPAQEIPFVYAPDAHFAFRPGAWNIAVDPSAFIPPSDAAARKAMMAMAKGTLIAWDPIAQREMWRVTHDGFWNAGVLSTAGNLVFQGQGSGRFEAYRADSGAFLWGFDAPSGIIAAPITYAVNGVQYIAVLSGWGGIAVNASKGPQQQVAPPGRVLAFKLAGSAKLPPQTPIPLKPPNPSADPSTAAQLAAGRDAYSRNCGVCHGFGGIGGDILPDLRRASALSDRVLWHAIVLGGVLESNGMVSFRKYLSAEDAEAIRAYISAQARLLEATPPATSSALP